MKQLDLFSPEEVGNVQVEAQDSKYSKKAQMPIYTPSGRLVNLYGCYDHLCSAIV